MWQFAEAVRGLADACLELGVPVTGGNVSFYNQTGEVAILPTPIVGVLGVLDDVVRRTPLGFRAPGQAIYLLGETRDEFGGSEWAHVVHGHLGGRPPAVDLAAERALAEILVAASQDGFIDAAHDLSDGGLAVAVAEACTRYGVGARIALPDGADLFVALFSESVARAIVAVSPEHEAAFTALCRAREFPVTPIGVTGGDALEVGGLFGVTVAELRDTSVGVLPTLFD